MLYNNIRLCLLTCITTILLTNTAIAAEDKKIITSGNTTTLHPGLDFIDRHFATFDHYWNNIFDDRLSMYDSSSRKNKFITQDKQYVLVLAVPGYDKNNIKVKANNNKLFIDGNIDDTKENSTTDHLNRKFNYVISLYDDIDQKTISAKLKNGILTIILPRIESKEQDAKAISIQ